MDKHLMIDEDGEWWSTFTALEKAGISPNTISEKCVAWRRAESNSWQNKDDRQDYRVKWVKLSSIPFGDIKLESEDNKMREHLRVQKRYITEGVEAYQETVKRGGETKFGFLTLHKDVLHRSELAVQNKLDAIKQAADNVNQDAAQ